MEHSIGLGQTDFVILFAYSRNDQVMINENIKNKGLELILSLLCIIGAISIIGIVTRVIIGVGEVVTLLSIMGLIISMAAVITLMLVLVIITSIINISEQLRNLSQVDKERLKYQRNPKLHFFKTWLPKHKREEIPGDLNEIKAAMTEAGFSKRKIKWQLTQLKISILWNLYKRQLLDWFSQQIEISK